MLQNRGNEVVAALQRIQGKKQSFDPVTHRTGILADGRKFLAFVLIHLAFRCPMSDWSKSTKPSSNAGDSGLSRKSRPAASRKSGSA